MRKASSSLAFPFIALRDLSYDCYIKVLTTKHGLHRRQLLFATSVHIVSCLNETKGNATNQEMAQYMPPTDQQLPPPPLSRGASNTSTNKYIPESYQQQPPSTPSAPGRSRGPSLGGQQIPSTPPISQTPPYDGSPGMLAPQSPVRPAYPTSYSYQPAPNVGYPGGQDTLRPPVENRRHSSGSTYSNSDNRDGTRSPRSNRSSPGPNQRDGRSRDSARRSRDRSRSRKDSRRRHSDSDQNIKPLGRVRTRPTLGDTMFSLFGTVKDALGPRDRY